MRGEQMYVRSADGEMLVPLERFAIGLAWQASICAYSPTNSDDDLILAQCDKRAEVIARMDDVTEWLNADDVWTTDDDRLMTKPKVYEFSKPIGYWRQG